jgi:hypothetical protein
MGVGLREAVGRVTEAASILIDADPTTRSVGVGRRYAQDHEYVVVRNIRAAAADAARLRAYPQPSAVLGVPVRYVDRLTDPQSLVRLPHSGPGSPGVASLIGEQQRHRALVCGLQIQNFDDDFGQGEIAGGNMIVGTLGCFVRLADQRVALLSNNHVVAGANRGRARPDRILQPGSKVFSPGDHAATLTDFKDLLVSPPGASVTAGTAVMNQIDAGIAVLSSGASHSQSYLPGRSGARAPLGTATAAIGDRVHKVGRTTGLTFGEVKQVSTEVVVRYGIGDVWFDQSIVIEGNDGTTFADRGDSGAAIVRDDGMVIGLLYCGNGSESWACPIDLVMGAFNCNLA